MFMKCLVDDNIRCVSYKADVDSIRDICKDGSYACIVVLDSGERPCGYILPENLSGNDQELDSIEQIIRTDFRIVKEYGEIESLIGNSRPAILPSLFVIVAINTVMGITFTSTLLAEIQHKNDFLIGILDKLDLGIVAVDTNEIVNFINSKFYQIHSLDHNIEGENIYRRLPESLISLPLKNPNETSFAGPVRFNKSGATVLPTYKSVKDNSGDLLGAVAIVREYINNKNIGVTTNEVTSLSHLFSSIFSNISDIVFCLDVNRYIFYANESFTNFFGKKAGEQLNDDNINEFHANILSSNTSNKCEQACVLENHAGAVMYVTATGFSISNNNDIAEGTVIILKDTTSEKNLSDKLESQTGLLQYFKQQSTDFPKEMICINYAFQEVVSTALKIAPSEANVLIDGENGVGKEMLAKLVHSNSKRSSKVFIPVNCGAIPEHLWESEMFGYEEGAFTGAKKGGKKGILELADGGTVLLDEIGELSLQAQVKILRFLQDMEISKVGMKEVKHVDVRVIAATNKSLKQLVDEGKFRIDLFYRLNVVNLRIPPLRERKEDIPYLAGKFINTYNAKYGKSATISDEASALLLKQNWPGNIRQLKNVIEHGVLMCDDEIQTIHFPQHMSSEIKAAQPEAYPSHSMGFNLNNHVQELEKEKMIEALKMTNGNRSKAMNLLNISRKTFYNKLKKYDLM